MGGEAMPVLARRLFAAALPLTFAVVVFGAYVRLADAGLGCPDWPGCYGQLVGVADADAAARLYPGGEYDRRKAWIEVGHRYIAALLGLLLAAAAAADYRARRRWRLPQWLLLLVGAQALLGMLTVTEKLRPIIVIAHLCGGLLILSLLAMVCARRPLPLAPPPRLRLWLHAAAAAVIAQIILGGWVSANYAGLSCGAEFPLCRGGWLPPAADFSGYHPWRDLGRDAAGAPLSDAALTTIHWLHRAGAVVAAFFAGGAAVCLWRGRLRREAAGLAGVLTAQILLGIVNVLWQLPLAAAVLHNAFAAVLIVNIAVLRVKLGTGR